MTLPAPHRDDSPSDLELLTARGWSAIPWDYNALISLVFESSGLGRLTLGYGQFIYGLVNFRFAVHDNNTLLIEYERTPGVAYIPDFVPDPAHAYKNVQYSLVPNHGSGATDSLLRYEGNAVLHPFAWDFRLTLNDSPFPYNLPEPDFRPPSAPTRKVPCASITAACRWRPLPPILPARPHHNWRPRAPVRMSAQRSRAELAASTLHPSRCRLRRCVATSPTLVKTAPGF